MRSAITLVLLLLGAFWVFTAVAYVSVTADRARVFHEVEVLYGIDSISKGAPPYCNLYHLAHDAPNLPPISSLKGYDEAKQFCEKVFPSLLVKISCPDGHQCLLDEAGEAFLWKIDE